MAGDDIDRKIRATFEGIARPKPKTKKRATRAEQERAHHERLAERRIRKIVAGVERKRSR